MRWVVFIFFAALLLTVQSALAPALAVFGARPDWLLATVVFFALHARPREAVISAWLIGMGADLMTVERMGLLALSYTLVALMVSSIRLHVFKLNAFTQFVLTAAMAALLNTAWLIYARVAYDPAQSAVAAVMSQVILGSLYTAVWAPPIHSGLFAAARWFGLPRPRYTFAGGQHVPGAVRV